jgi:hypothetical protein
MEQSPELNSGAIVGSSLLTLSVQVSDLNLLFLTQLNPYHSFGFQVGCRYF